MNKMFKEEDGFTLIEIIAILVVMGILMVVTISRIISADTYQTSGELDKVTSHLRYAQGRAIRTDSTWGIRFNNGSTYWLFQNVGTNSVQATFAGEGSNQVTLSTLLVTSAPQNITFDRFGSPGAADIIITTSGGNKTVAADTGFIP